ncbi:MAG: hypothetical protein ABFD96_06490 [Armatimonadia bacterium]
MSRHTKIARALFVVTILLSIAVTYHVTTRPLLDMLGFVPDDAFYYLQIARNIAAGLGSSFDGETTTNGYHPGWMVVLAGFAHLIQGREALLRTALVTCFALNTATGLAIALLFRRWFGAAWGWTAGALWFVFPWPYLLATQVVEASLYALILVLVALAASRLVAPTNGAPSSAKQVFLLGLVIGLAIVARTEGVVLLVCALPWIFFWVRGTGSRPSAMQGGLYAGILVAGAALVLAPPALYSLSHFGGICQDSGAMKLLWQSPHPPLVALKLNILIVAPALLAALVLPYRKAIWAQSVLCLLAATSLQALIYRVSFADIQFWYLALPTVTLFIGFLAAIAAWTGSYQAGTRTLVPWLAIVLFGLTGVLSVAYQSHDMVTLNCYPWQRDVYTSQLAINRTLTETDRVGCFNAGIPAYFSDRFVTNLDGLVNHQIHPFYLTQRIEDYIRLNRISVLCDEKDALSRASQYMTRPLNLVPVQRYPLAGWGGAEQYRYVWQVRSTPEPGRAAIGANPDH